MEMAREIEKFKQNLLLKHVLPVDCCLFSDVTKLKSDKERLCARHTNACVTLFVIGIDHGCKVLPVAF